MLDKLLFSEDGFKISTHNFNKSQFMTDLLPFIYHALHPEIQDTSM